MARFASTGAITDDLLADIQREAVERNAIAWGDMGTIWRAIRGERVTVWAVGSNHAGYLPEGDVYVSLDRSDAMMGFVARLESAADDLAQECECEPDAAELCDHCSIDAHAKSFLADESACEGDLSVALRPDSQPFHTIYWLIETTRTVEDYASQRDEWQHLTSCGCHAR